MAPSRELRISEGRRDLFLHLLSLFISRARGQEKLWIFRRAYMKIPKAPPAKATMMLTELSVNEARKRVVLRRVRFIFNTRYACSYLPWKKKKIFFTSTPTNGQLPLYRILLNRVVAPYEYMYKYMRYTLSSLDQTISGESRDSGRYMYYRIVEYVKSYETRSRLCQQL